MKTLVQLHVSELPVELREAMRQLNPNGNSVGDMYDCELNLDDARLAAIEAKLAKHGYRRWRGDSERNRKTEYSVNFIRAYDEADFKQMEYLELHYPYEEELHDGFPGGVKERVIGGKDIIDGRDFYATLSAVMIVPARTRQLLEPSELIGLSFAPVTVDPNGSGPYNYDRRRRKMPIKGMPFWEIVPTVKLPPVSTTMELADLKLNPLPPGDESANYTEREWPYNFAELHFRRSDIEAMPPFDVARTREHFLRTPRTIVSRRFYQTCRDFGLRGQWVPVHLD